MSEPIMSSAHLCMQAVKTFKTRTEKYGREMLLEIHCIYEICWLPPFGASHNVGMTKTHRTTRFSRFKKMLYGYDSGQGGGHLKSLFLA